MEIKAKLLQKETQDIFQRYNWRDDIEEGLHDVDWIELFGDPDEKIYYNPKKTFDLLLYINWVDGIYSIYNRTVKENIHD